MKTMSEDVTTEEQQTSKSVEVFDSTSSDPIGYHPCVQLQEERLQFAQPTLLLLLLLLTVPSFLVDSLIFSLLFLLLVVHPGYPGSAVPAGIGSRVVWREVNLNGCLVVVGETGQQLLDHIRSLVGQVPPLAGVVCDVEQPDVFVGGGFV